MKAILDFILEYWEVLSSLVLLLISIILLIIKKKPISSIPELIYQYAILGIEEAEETCKDLPTDSKSDVKLARAIGFVVHSLKQKYPDIKLGNYLDYIGFVIEDILSTPQKKERSKNEAQKDD